MTAAQQLDALGGAPPPPKKKAATTRGEAAAERALQQEVDDQVGRQSVRWRANDHQAHEAARRCLEAGVARLETPDTPFETMLGTPHPAAPTDILATHREVVELASMAAVHLGHTKGWGHGAPDLRMVRWLLADGDTYLAGTVLRANLAHVNALRREGGDLSLEPGPTHAAVELAEALLPVRAFMAGNDGFYGGLDALRGKAPEGMPDDVWDAALDYLHERVADLEAMLAKVAHRLDYLLPFLGLEEEPGTLNPADRDKLAALENTCADIDSFDYMAFKNAPACDASPYMLCDPPLAGGPCRFCRRVWKARTTFELAGADEVVRPVDALGDA